MTNNKEPDARIRIDKMLIEAGWKLPGWSKDEEINVKTEINNASGEADYVLLSSKENDFADVVFPNAIVIFESRLL